METIGERLKEERKRLGLSQPKFAEIGGVKKGAQIKYEANDRNPDAAYWANVIRAGVDVQYVFTGTRSVNMPSFEDKVAEVHRVTERVMRIAESQSPKPDAYSLGPLRDLAYSAHLSDEQIQVIFNLLQLSKEPGFWPGSSGSGKTQVSQVFHGDTENSQITTGDMTVHNVYNDKDDKS